MWRGLLIFAFAMMVVGIPGSADQIPNLTGSWNGVSVNQFSESDGYKNLTDIQNYQIKNTQEGRIFIGNETYHESLDGATINESTAGIISSDGKYFWRDHDKSGISFGEILSDNEYTDYTLFPDDGTFIISTHLVKDGTKPSVTIPDPINLTGSWNSSQQRRNGDNSSSGIFNLEDQQGRFFTGDFEITEEDGAFLKIHLIGIIGTTNKLYTITDNHALYIGEITGKNSLHFTIIHPQDDDGTFVLDRRLTRNSESVDNIATSYPNITGDWNITARTVIQNGTISDIGPTETEWMNYSNQTGPFFTATRHSEDPATPPVMKIAGIFSHEKEAYLASAAPTYVIYHIIDDKSIEALVMRKEGDPALYLDILVRNVTS